MNANKEDISNDPKPLLANGLCYVVECSSGCYDDYHSWIAGIYLNASDAEKLKNEITTNIEIKKNIPFPFDEKQLEFLTDEQEKQYYNWWHINNDANNFNSAIVVEYPINEPCT
jgi:hypothetical protein